MEVSAQKKLLRREMRARRKSLTEIDREKFSSDIVEKFLSQEIYRSSKIVMAYVSMPEEVQLNKIFIDAFNRGKILAIPLIIGKGEMQPVIFPDLNSLEIGEFGIKTVREGYRKFIDADKIDCVIVPGAAFDLNKNRLGLGGGYYDNFLIRAGRAKKVALAYDFQIVENLPIEPHDSPVDMIITENRIIK